MAIVFTAATAMLFSLGAWLFVTQLSSGLVRLLDSQLQADLSQGGRIVATASKSAAGTRLPLPGQVVLQVLDASGHLRGSTPDSGDTPLLAAGQVRQAGRSTITVTTSLEGESERVVAGPFPSHPGWVVVAGSSLETLDRTVSDVENGLVIAGVCVLLVSGLGAYGLAWASLSPVERLRREVASLSERGRSSAVEVPHTRDEIAALARTMNELLARLEASLTRQRAFVSDAGHELRTPFAVLQGELELASRPGRTPEEVSLALGRASEEAGRLTRFANDLLLLARGDEDQLEVHRVPTPIGALLSESVHGHAGRASEAGVRCRVEAAGGLTASVDPDRIRQAVDNLLDNALRFAPSGSEIVLAARVDGPSLRIDVADQGPGFPPEYLPHAFERFSRPDSGRTRNSGGTGLGLAIVHAIVRAHGGHVAVGNRVDGGARVVIQLPAEASGAP